MYGDDAGLQVCLAMDVAPSGFIGLVDDVQGTCEINPKQGFTDNSNLYEI